MERDPGDGGSSLDLNFNLNSPFRGLVTQIKFCWRKTKDKMSSHRLLQCQKVKSIWANDKQDYSGNHEHQARPAQASSAWTRQTNQAQLPSLHLQWREAAVWGWIVKIINLIRKLTDCLNTIRDKNWGDRRIRRERESQESRLQNLRLQLNLTLDKKTLPFTSGHEGATIKQNCVTRQCNTQRSPAEELIMVVKPNIFGPNN